jgi:uncharacterized protein YoaH (UPF0181 family)
MAPRAPGTNHPPHKREKKGLAERDKRVAQRVAEGMSKEDALEAVMKELRDNPKMDWRRGS